MNILIKQANIVSAESSWPADVLVNEGKIALIRPEISPARRPDLVIDAEGLLLMPGGIDPHVHMHLPTAAGYSSDDFLSGSKAALMGGTTSLIDFVTPKKGQNLVEALQLRKEEAANALIPVAFHVSPIEWRDSLAEEIRHCVTLGVRSFKVYMAYKDSIGIDLEVLEKIMEVVAASGALLTIHAEMGDEIEALRSHYFKSEPNGPLAHGLSRPAQTESLAVARAIDLGVKTSCPLYFVHVSCADSLKHIREAQKGGHKVYAEACLHHLIFDESRYHAPFHEAAPFVFSPPLRPASDREALWEGLADGTIQVVGTDHCPFHMEQKNLGRDDFRKIANGTGGVEYRLPILYAEGVLKKRISPERFVALVSGNPARIFGLSPQKGRVSAGADADLILWDPLQTMVVDAAMQHQNCDHTIYQGMSVSGAARHVISQGRLMVKDFAPVFQA